jgi:hypothetical protein
LIIFDILSIPHRFRLDASVALRTACIRKLTRTIPPFPGSDGLEPMTSLPGRVRNAADAGGLCDIPPVPWPASGGAGKPCGSGHIEDDPRVPGC